MSNIHKILDIISIINDTGDIAFKKYSKDLFREVEELIIFNNPNRVDSLDKVKFIDKRWLMRDETKSISFDGLNIIFEYELKSIILGSLFLGQKRNYRKLKWSTVCLKIRTLKKMALLLDTINLSSFNDLNNLKAINLQIFAKKFRDSTDDKNDILTPACFTLLNYNFINQKTYEILTLNQSSEDTDFSKKLGRYASNSFPIIPNNALLKTFVEINKYKDEFYLKYKLWLKYNNEEIENINNGIYNISNGQYLSKREHDSLNCGNFTAFLNKFRKVVAFNTLLFTGMRKDEVKELKGNCIYVENDVFYVESSLSKTVENRLDLSWVSSESCNEMIKILIDINEQVKKRVKAVLNTNDLRFSKKYITHLETNLNDDKIFTFNYSLNLCKFDTLNYIKNKEMNKNYSIFKIALDQSDIDQLEFLNCNYKNTSKSSSEYLTKYKVGDLFNFSPHQFRHTFAFFMISNNLCTINEIKHQFKHVRSSMTFIYSRRAIYSELISHCENLDETIKAKSLMRFSDSIATQKSTGGGVKFILNALELKDFKYNISFDPLEHKNLEQINSYLLNNKDSINFLPHGFCMNGADCSFDSIAKPLNCINCHGYVTTDFNLPYWNGLLKDIQTKLSKINKLSADASVQYSNLKSNLEQKEVQLIDVINKLNAKKINVNQIEII